MDNPAGNRANHHPSVCLQSSVGRRVSTACLINDTDHQYLKSKHQKRQVHPSASTYPWGKPASGYWKRTLEYQKQKMPKSQNIKKGYHDSLRTISAIGRLNFWNGTGCLDIAFFTCFTTICLDPPCATILSHNDLARGMKSSTSRVQRAIRRNSDIIEP